MQESPKVVFEERKKMVNILAKFDTKMAYNTEKEFSQQ